MTLVSQLITDAYRKGNLIPLGLVPSAEQQSEALRYLNRIVQSALGNEVGDPLTSYPIGRTHINRPAGFPWWNTVPDSNWFVPKNTRLMCNLDQSLTLYLHPDPNDGTRFAVIDSSNSFADHPVTLNANGRQINGAFELVLNQAGYDQEFFYRADLGQWMRSFPLDITDEFPFPIDFDDYFIFSLAMSLNPAYSIELDPQSLKSFQRSQSQIVARYKQEVPQRAELGLIRPALTAADRDMWGNSQWFYNPTDMFNKGWPF